MLQIHMMGLGEESFITLMAILYQIALFSLLDFMTIKNTDPETLFKVSDFKGFGNSFTAGFGSGFSWGGSSPVQAHDGVNLLSKQEWGRYPGGYSTFGFSYGLTKERPAFGISLSRTQTRFVSDIPKDWR